MKLEKIFDKTIKILSLALFTWIIIILLFFENQPGFTHRTEVLINNLIIVGIDALIIFMYIFLFKIKKIKIKEINYDKVVKIMIFVLFLIQLYIFYHTYFETGWDASIVDNTARIIANGKKPGYLDYYSMYPNNILYTVISALILKINSICGIFIKDYDLMSIVFVNCFVSSLSSYLVYKIGKQLFNKKIAFIGYLISVFLFVLSPWNIICYSDSISIFLPILILYIYIKKELKYYYKFPLIALLGYLSISIKPQTFIIVIAIIIVEIIKNIARISVKRIKKIFAVTFISLIFVLLTSIFLNNTYRSLGFKLDKNKKMEYTHFLMMGANSKNYGCWSGEDIVYSQSFPDTKTRKQNNIKEYKNRVVSYGPIGYFEFLSKKLTKIYNDGTYAWMWEGNFFIGKKPVTVDFSNNLRDIYYGKYYKYYGTMMQFIWISILMIIFANIVLELLKKQKEINYIYLVVILTIIGLTLFELLFEARARYLYSNSPIFIILMMYGISNIRNIKVTKKTQKNTKKIKSTS